MKRLGVTRKVLLGTAFLLISAAHAEVTRIEVLSSEPLLREAVDMASPCQ